MAFVRAASAIITAVSAEWGLMAESDAAVSPASTNCLATCCVHALSHRPLTNGGRWRAVTAGRHRRRFNDIRERDAHPACSGETLTPRTSRFPQHPVCKMAGCRYVYRPLGETTQVAAHWHLLEPHRWRAAVNVRPFCDSNLYEHSKE